MVRRFVSLYPKRQLASMASQKAAQQPAQPDEGQRQQQQQGGGCKRRRETEQEAVVNPDQGIGGAGWGDETGGPHNISAAAAASATPPPARTTMLPAAAAAVMGSKVMRIGSGARATGKPSAGAPAVHASLPSFIRAGGAAMRQAKTTVPGKPKEGRGAAAALPVCKVQRLGPFTHSKTLQQRREQQQQQEVGRNKPQNAGFSGPPFRCGCRLHCCSQVISTYGETILVEGAWCAVHCMWHLPDSRVCGAAVRVMVEGRSNASASILTPKAAPVPIPTGRAPAPTIHGMTTGEDTKYVFQRLVDGKPGFTEATLNIGISSMENARVLTFNDKRSKSTKDHRHFVEPRHGRRPGPDCVSAWGTDS
eukprot:771541-Pelagomonas_calceolata.AAC.1